MKGRYQFWKSSVAAKYAVCPSDRLSYKYDEFDQIQRFEYS